MSRLSQWNIATSSAASTARPSAYAGFDAPRDRVDFGSTPEQAPDHELRGARRQGTAPVAVTFNGAYYDAQGDAVAKNNYYGDPAHFNSMTPGQLFDEFNKKLTSTHRPHKYDPDTYLYPQIDRHQDGQLYCIYSGQGPELPKGDTSHPLAKGEYNCEHVVPQSWFNKKPTPRGDLHHLFASLMECNSLRGNAQYDTGVSEGQEIVACGIRDKEKNLFNPANGHGATARAVLYFMMRYPGEIGDRPSEYGVNDLPMLLKWHKENPPTEYELHRNSWIEREQGNRNPLIDFPELAEKIDFSKGIGSQGRAA